MVIKKFTQKGIDLVAKMAAGVWGKEQGAHSSEVARIFCQHLTRYSLYSSDLAFQAEDEEGLQAIAFDPPRDYQSRGLLPSGMS